MTGPRYQLFDPFVDDELAARLPRLAESFGPYNVYIEGPVESGFGAGLVRRHDAAINYVRTAGDSEDLSSALARLNLFRGTYALHDEIRLPGVEPLYASPLFCEAAQELTGCTLVRPSMLYANLLLPGQELAMHTDTPEYRGLDKWKVPEWFLVVMFHSGLFERWRKRVTAGVAFFTDCSGGDFVFYPNGPAGEPARVPVRHNTAIHLDVDGLFHGVERVGGPDQPAPPHTPEMQLCYAGDDTWQVRHGERVVASYHWDQLRFSVQWKANCFADAVEEALVHSHADDLTQVQVIERLVADLRERGVVGSELPNDAELAVVMMNTYIEFPDGRSGSAAG